MTREYFGTDGIRGTVGQPPITPDFVLRLAHAVGRVLKKSESRPTVLIGKDTRISGYMLESALESGFNSAGVDVVLLGPLPTPGVAYLTRAQRASLGVVISATTTLIRQRIKFSAPRAPSSAMNGVAAEAVLKGHLCGSTQDPGQGAALNVRRGAIDPARAFANDRRCAASVIDAAHGAAYRWLSVFHELGAEVTASAVRPTA
jgi:phosphoglucosamine mutase